jgi:squalene-associated FAD-dependent desaturase
MLSASTQSVTQSVAVIGGGVSGIAASIALADAGFNVELIEKRPLLGGRASSFIDSQTGQRLDECQHGTMRCCTNLADLLDRLGVHNLIDYHDTIHFLDADGKRSVIKGSFLPAPLHTSFSFLMFRSLNISDKLAIARGMIAMLRTKPSPADESTSIETWFAKQKQTERAVKRFWEPVLVSACNDSLDRISCTHAFKIFVDGFLKHPRAFHFGVPKVPLGTLYTESTVAYLQKRGACVRLKTTVNEMHFDGGRISHLALTDGETIKTDYYVSGLQCDLLLKMLPSHISESDPYFANLRKVELVPIIGVHLWFDREIDCPAAISLLDRESDWIFNKTKNFGLNSQGGTYLSVVISAPGELEQWPKGKVIAHVLEDVRAAVPEARKAEVSRSLMVKWPKATFSPKPGVDAYRPSQKSPVENLFVAGEWTQTGWPSTMESAARSGYLAAEYVCNASGRPQAFLAPDLKPGALAKLMSRR